MNCPQCGQPVQPGAQVCNNCGQVLQQAAPVPNVSDPTSQPIAPTAADSQASSVAAGSYASSAPMGQAWPTAQVSAAQPQQVFGAPSIVPTAAAPAANSKAFSKIVIIAVLLIIILGALGVGAWRLLSAKSSSVTKNQTSTQTGGQSQQSQSTINTANLTAVNTPCYTAKVTPRLGNSLSNGCTFATGTTGGESFSVVGTVNHSITAANLAQQGQADFSATATTLGEPIVSEQSGTFAGSPAYIGVFKTKNNTTVITAIVFHQTTPGDNVFSIGHTYGTVVSNPTLEPLASTWQWK